MGGPFHFWRVHESPVTAGRVERDHRGDVLPRRLRQAVAARPGGLHPVAGALRSAGGDASRSAITSSRDALLGHLSADKALLGEGQL